MKILLVIAVIIAIVTPLAAHHSFSAEFDMSKPAYMDGKVTMVQWGNPHVWVFIDVTNKANGTVNWKILLSGTQDLIDDGWKMDTLRPGMDVCVEGFPAKDGTHHFGSASTLTVKSTGQVLKNTGSIWKAPTYTGKTSCANRG